MSGESIEQTQTAILRMQGVHKSFGASAALTSVRFELNAREIHGLLGGNGAGKTTLMNILYGLYRMDAGEIFLHDQRVEIHSPKDAIEQRIGMVHQHFLQVKTFTVIQNIILGSPTKNKLAINLEQEERKLKELSERFSLEMDLNALIDDLPMGSRQKVEILKALYRGVEILILDEPTTNLTPQEVDALFKSLRVMVNEGMSIVFITHKLPEVLSVCDRISVLRNGLNVLTLRRSEATEEAFVRAMVGDEMNIEHSVIFSNRSGEESPVGVAKAVELDRVKVVTEDKITRLKDVSLEIREGEILGIAGVAGNGQRQLAELLTGVYPAAEGTVRILGRDVTHARAEELLRIGVGYIPEDRLHDGFLPKASVAHNMILGYHRQKPFSQNGMMNWKIIFEHTLEMIQYFNVKTLGPKDTGANLSGGNIQRVMIARALAHNCKVLVAHNPTRGLDIPSMDFFYANVLDLKKKGGATLLLSENLDELLLMCDRIAVIYSGEIMGVLERGMFEKYQIGRMMSGVRTDA